jgi:iron-sulfur cluster repair protein YtfE (RIC family)
MEGNMKIITQDSLDGRHQQVIESHYLHSIWSNYDYVRSNYLEKINLKLSKSIWNNIIRNQQAREDRFLEKLGIQADTSKKKMMALNRWVKNNELLKNVVAVKSDYIDSVLEEALQSSLIFYGNEEANDSSPAEMVSLVVKILSKYKQEEMDEIVTNYNRDLGNNFEEFENNISLIIDKYLKNHNGELNDLKTAVSKSKEVQNLKGSILKQGLKAALDEITIELIKDKNITTTERIAHQRLKQSYESKIEVNADLNNKLIRMQKDNLDSLLDFKDIDTTIDNFISRMASYPSLQDGVNQYDANRDSIIYSIVNDLLFTKYNASKSYLLQDILKMARQSVLYMGIDKLNRKEVGDFLFINDKLVPFSFIMEKIRDYESFKPKAEIGKKIKPYSKRILQAKKKSAIIDGEYYTGALSIGATNGDLIWQSIRLKNLDLQLKLKL